ncbi:hypothetical protein [Fluviicola sp.]|uniref:hypothetical protein n=1 Tax=Fluviicola sp. TaxID=1917219 RepID=UPI00262BA910|nr:hypothetical protein [Fluviicola sp.]
MKNALIFFIAGIIILLNGYIGHYFPPNGILSTPLALGISCGLIVFFTENLKILYKSLLLIVCAVFNGYLTVNYSGGIHDDEGIILIGFFLFFGSIINFVILLLGLFFTGKEETWKEKLLAICLYPISMLIYFQMQIA